MSIISDRFADRKAVFVCLKGGRGLAIRASDAIAAARALIGTPYAQLDCIGLIVRVIRTAPGGDAAYRTAGTNTLWRSLHDAPRYRDLTWRQEGIAGAAAGMLAFKRRAEDIHHVGLVTGEGTVIHSSSVSGRVVETALDGAWTLLGVHRLIDAQPRETGECLYTARVSTARDPLRIRKKPVNGRIIGRVPRGAMVRVLENDGSGWPRIDYEGVVGVACGAYLTQVDD